MEGVVKEHYIFNMRLKREWFVNVEKICGSSNPKENVRY